MTANILSTKTTEELKQQLLELTQDRDKDPISKKVQFAKNQLIPLFEELEKRNPFPHPTEQTPLVVGFWKPIWSTIPFQDLIPGRLHNQSYQIFHDDGYYANIARYAPGNKLPLLNKISSLLLAYDLMIVQRFEIQNESWYIENIAIKQALRGKATALTPEKAEKWFTKVVYAYKESSSEEKEINADSSLENLDKSTAKRFQKVFRSIPQLEHLYIDENFRLVKSRREASQRPSYTIAVRLK